MNIDKNQTQVQEHGKFPQMPFFPFPYMFNTPRNVESYRLNAAIDEAQLNILVLANPDSSIGEINRGPG